MNNIFGAYLYNWGLRGIPTEEEHNSEFLLMLLYAVSRQKEEIKVIVSKSLDGKKITEQECELH